MTSAAVTDVQELHARKRIVTPLLVVDEMKGAALDALSSGYTFAPTTVNGNVLTPGIAIGGALTLTNDVTADTNVSAAATFDFARTTLTQVTTTGATGEYNVLTKNDAKIGSVTTDGTGKVFFTVDWPHAVFGPSKSVASSSAYILDEVTLEVIPLHVFGSGSDVAMKGVVGTQITNGTLFISFETAEIF